MGREALPSDFEDCIGIFQGGGCRAAAYAGAYAAAKDRGINFSQVAGASAGAIAAVLIAAGATPEELDKMLRNLDFSKFVGKPGGRLLATKGKTIVGQLWNLVFFNGIHDGRRLEAWLEDQLRALLPHAPNKRILFEDLRKPVAVIAADVELQGPKVWSKAETPREPVADAVRASCSIPFFFQPHGRFVDGGVVSNLPLHIVSNDPSDRRRVLAFTLVDRAAVSRPTSVMATATAVAGTVTNGGQEVQTALQRDVDVIRIQCNDVKATDFQKMTPEVISDLIEAGQSAVNNFFDRGVAAIKPVAPSQVSYGRAQTLATVAQNILGARAQVLISARDTEWVFDLYSALLTTRLNGVKVCIAIPVDGSTSSQAQQQRATLAALGCQLAEAPFDDMPKIEGFVCDPGEMTASAVVLSRKGLQIDARLLTNADGDESTIEVLADEIGKNSFCGESSAALALELVPDADVIATLKKVPQYSEGQIVEMCEVELELIDSWAKYAFLYKQSQQRAMLFTLRSHDINNFAAYYVRYGATKRSMALPIVLEKSRDGRCTVVNGLSRLLLLRREGQTKVRCAVVSGVVAAPPAGEVVRLSDVDVRVGIHKDTSVRYTGFVYSNVRKVEADANRLCDVAD